MRINRARVYEVLEASKRGDAVGRSVDVFIISLIVLNVIAVILQSIDPIQTRFERVFDLFEVLSVAVFALEYVARLWACTAREEYRHPVFGRLRFAVSPFALIDLAAIVPFFLPKGADLRFLRVLRLFKIGRYFKPMRILVRVISARRDELWMSIFVIAVLLILASSAMYEVEHDVQPEHFSSIPAAMWWGVATLTTVGYGDVFPVTSLGKVLGAVIAVLGVGMFAIPAGILASGFSDAFGKQDAAPAAPAAPRQCSHCGRDVSSGDDPGRDET